MFRQIDKIYLELSSCRSIIINAVPAIDIISMCGELPMETRVGHQLRSVFTGTSSRNSGMLGNIPEFRVNCIASLNRDYGVARPGPSSMHSRKLSPSFMMLSPFTSTHQRPPR